MSQNWQKMAKMLHNAAKKFDWVRAALIWKRSTDTSKRMPVSTVRDISYKGEMRLIFYTSLWIFLPYSDLQNSKVEQNYSLMIPYEVSLEDSVE